MMDALLSSGGVDLKLSVGKNVWLDISKIQKQFRILTSLEEDLLAVAAFIYSADLAIKRKEREDFVRDISLTIPVVNQAGFSGIRQQLEDILRVLSHDNWNIEFVGRPGTPEPNQKWARQSGTTLLFSGGLDSFAGACQLLKSQDEMFLVSHVTHNRPVASSQAQLVQELEKHFARQISHIQLLFHCRQHKGYPFPQDNDREETQRTRSFLFVVLAAVAARMNGSRRVLMMAENGQFAIHLPLTAARVGAFSTHTAHPEYLAKMQRMLRELLLCSDLTLSNPFEHKTKAEVVDCIPNELRSSIGKSISCWMTSRLATYTHCGECVPCLSRRIALEQHGIQLKEYKRDLLRENIAQVAPDDNGKRNLVDLLEFVAHFAGPYAIQDEQELTIEFPELINPHVNRKDTIAMYRRFAHAATGVFKKYKNIAALLK